MEGGGFTRAIFPFKSTTLLSLSLQCRRGVSSSPNMPTRPLSWLTRLANERRRFPVSPLPRIVSSVCLPLTPTSPWGLPCSSSPNMPARPLSLLTRLTNERRHFPVSPLPQIISSVCLLLTHTSPRGLPCGLTSRNKPASLLSWSTFVPPPSLQQTPTRSAYDDHFIPSVTYVRHLI